MIALIPIIALLAAVALITPIMEKADKNYIRRQKEEAEKALHERLLAAPALTNRQGQGGSYASPGIADPAMAAVLGSGGTANVSALPPFADAANQPRSRRQLQ